MCGAEGVAKLREPGADSKLILILKGVVGLVRPGDVEHQVVPLLGLPRAIRAVELRLLPAFEAHVPPERVLAAVALVAVGALDVGPWLVRGRRGRRGVAAWQRDGRVQPRHVRVDGFQRGDQRTSDHHLRVCN